MAKLHPSMSLISRAPMHGMQCEAARAHEEPCCSLPLTWRGGTRAPQQAACAQF